VEQHEKMRAEKLRARDYKGYLNLFGRENPLPAFLKIEHLISDEQYWTYLNDIWCLLEISAPDLAEWLRLFTSPRPHRELLMSGAERARLAAMPETLTIYRGYAKRRGRSGLSWTLSKDKARWFAEYATCGGRRYHFCGHRSGGIGMIVRGQCRKGDVLAYFEKEQEIVIDPRNVSAMRSRPALLKPGTLVHS
jgi:hypothetical protein